MLLSVHTHVHTVCKYVGLAFFIFHGCVVVGKYSEPSRSPQYNWQCDYDPTDSQSVCAEIVALSSHLYNMYTTSTVPNSTLL